MKSKLIKVISAFIGAALVASNAGPASASIFGSQDSDHSICANIGSGYDAPYPRPTDWPKYFIDNNLIGSTNWHCYYENGYLAESGHAPSMTIPVNSTLKIEKQDIQLAENGAPFAKSLSIVEWDYDGDGNYETSSRGPWLSAVGTSTTYYVNGSPTTTRSTKSTLFTGETTFTTTGNHTVNLRLTYSDSSQETASGTFNVISDEVTAVMKRTFGNGALDFMPMLTGEVTYFEAVNSISTSGSFSKYEWDLDGDGTFELDGGSIVSTKYATPGIRKVSLRVTSLGGNVDTDSMEVQVLKINTAARPSISINAGNPYTNTKNVELDIVWPKWATSMEVSNDGGFPASQSQTFELNDKTSWALDDSVYGLYTKVVYVRFSGIYIDANKVYSDDVVLDTTSPTLSTASSAKASGGTDGSIGTAASGFINENLRFAKKVKSSTKVISVKTKAKDDRSGLGKVQVSLNASGASSAIVAYKPQVKITVPKTAKKVWVRVADGAGNWSKWKVVKAK